MVRSASPTDTPTPRAGYPDLPLIVDQMQTQIDMLRELFESQQRQLEDVRARLAAVEAR